MNNTQLSVLLWHIMRQINLATSAVEIELRARGLSLEEAMTKVAELRALADVLKQQSMDLNRITVEALHA